MDTLQLDPPASTPDDEPLPDPLDVMPDAFGAPDAAFQGDRSVLAWM